MTTAREEAERRYPFPGRNAFVSELNAAREAFISGAQWQAKQPVEITDEMVERAALAGLNSERRRHGLDERTTLDDFDNQTAREWRADARAQLEAALGGEA
jgi:hypothetical protein